MGASAYRAKPDGPPDQAGQPAPATPTTSRQQEETAPRHPPTALRLPPMPVDVDPSCARPVAGERLLPVHVGTNGQASTWGALLAGFPPRS